MHPPRLAAPLRSWPLTIGPSHWPLDAAGPHGAQELAPLELGPPIRRTAPEPAEWIPVQGSPHIERNTRTGRLRTNIPARALSAPDTTPWVPPKGWPVR
jgi:hypothetical protein